MNRPDYEDRPRFFRRLLHLGIRSINSSMTHSSIQREELYRKFSIGLFLLLSLIGVFTVGDYGMTWDEHFRFEGGDAKLEYYQSLLSGEEAAVPGGSYPGLFDLPLALAHELFPEWGTRSQKGHAYSLLFGLAGLLAVWRMTALAGGERAGFWALLLLATMPRYYGHMFFNPKDIPLAATYALGLWALLAFFARLPAVGWRHVVWIGLAAGLAMSARIAGFLILCYFGLFALLYVLGRYGVEWRQGGNLSELPWLRDLKFWGLRGLCAGLIAAGILFVFWPTLHQNPFQGAASSLETVQAYGWDGMVLMGGRFWPAQDLPFYYIPYWLLRTVPDLILLLLFSGVVMGLLAVRQRLRQKAGDALLEAFSRPVSILIFATFFPLAYILWKAPTLYDGLRHVLFLLPPMAALAALSLEWILRRVEAKGARLIAIVVPCGALAAVALVVVNMITLHPYQYVYFNQLSGGLPAAYNRDETDYWGLSHKEAAEWLNEYVEQLDPDGEQVYQVHLRYSRWMLKEHLNPARFELTPERAGADFFVSITRFNLHASYPDAEALHVVERRGVPLCFVFKMPGGGE